MVVLETPCRVRIDLAACVNKWVLEQHTETTSVNHKQSFLMVRSISTCIGKEQSLSPAGAFLEVEEMIAEVNKEIYKV